jgi:ParB family chromosome partitioning protein
MNVQEIECELIDVPPLDRKPRSSSEELVKSIAQSIELEGLFNPIVVRPNPEKPGRFILVQGRKRLEAVWKELERESIRATIMIKIDEEDYAMATLSENLWRANIGKNQRLLHIKQWWEFYNKKYAPTSEKATDTPEQPTVFKQTAQQTNNGRNAHNQ